MKTVKVVLTVLALCAASAFAGSDYEEVVDDSVIGYWRFNDPNDYGKDSSGHGSGIVQWNNNASGGVVSVSTDWSRGGGCLELPRDGKGTTSSPYTYGTAVATVASGKGFSMERESPGWTAATWVRGSADLVESISNMRNVPDDSDAGRFKTALKDGKWHPLVIVYRPGRQSDFYRVYVDAFDSETVRDVTSGGTDDKGSPAWHIPLSVSSGVAANDTVTLGGGLGGTYNPLKIFPIEIKGNFFGGLDDCIIIDRELAGGGQKGNSETTVRTDDEVFRWVQTGETFVYSKGESGNMFYEKGNWSNGNAPRAGLAYIIENGYEVKAAKTATFAGKSLSIGRTEKLYGIKSVGGSKEVIVDNTVGKLTQQGANTTLTVDDLRLNDGTITADANGQSLTATFLAVGASAEKPFSISVGSGLAYTFSAGGEVAGSGVLAKTGAGRLTVSKWTGAAKLRIDEGAIKTPRLDGYTGGTVLVTKDAMVTFTGDDVRPTEQAKMKIAFDGEKPTAKTAVMTVPAGVTVTMIEDETQYDGDRVCAITVENGIVYIEPVYPEDKGAKPMLLWQ